MYTHTHDIIIQSYVLDELFALNRVTHHRYYYSIPYRLKFAREIPHEIVVYDPANVPKYNART